MLPKGNIKAQITTAIKHFSVKMKETNQRVVKKFIKTVYFMGRNKWAVKNKFEPLRNHIRDLGDEDLKKHTAIMAKNATYMSHFTADEMVKVICDYVEVKLLHDLLTAGDFLLLTDKSKDKPGRAQLSIFVRYVDVFTNKLKEEFVCIRKLSTSNTSKTLMNELEQMFIDKNINKKLI